MDYNIDSAEHQNCETVANEIILPDRVNTTVH